MNKFCTWLPFGLLVGFWISHTFSETRPSSIGIAQHGNVLVLDHAIPVPADDSTVIAVNHAEKTSHLLLDSRSVLSFKLSVDIRQNLIISIPPDLPTVVPLSEIYNKGVYIYLPNKFMDGRKGSDEDGAEQGMLALLINVDPDARQAVESNSFSGGDWPDDEPGNNGGAGNPSGNPVIPLFAVLDMLSEAESLLSGGINLRQQEMTDFIFVPKKSDAQWQRWHSGEIDALNAIWSIGKQPPLPADSSHMIVTVMVLNLLEQGDRPLIDADYELLLLALSAVRTDWQTIAALVELPREVVSQIENDYRHNTEQRYQQFIRALIDNKVILNELICIIYETLHNQVTAQNLAQVFGVLAPTASPRIQTGGGAFHIPVPIGIPSSPPVSSSKTKSSGRTEATAFTGIRPVLKAKKLHFATSETSDDHGFGSITGTWSGVHGQGSSSRPSPGMLFRSLLQFTKPEQLAALLGLRSGSFDSSRQVRDTVRNVLAEWAKSGGFSALAYSWESLVEALLIMGENQLAHGIAKEHNINIIEPSDKTLSLPKKNRERELFILLRGLSDNWEKFAVLMDIDMSAIKSINIENSHVDDRILALCKKLLSQLNSEGKALWIKIRTTLEKMGEHALAARIRLSP